MSDDQAAENSRLLWDAAFGEPSEHGPYTHSFKPGTVADLPWWSWQRLSPRQRWQRRQARKALERTGWFA